MAKKSKRSPRRQSSRGQRRATSNHRAQASGLSDHQDSSSDESAYFDKKNLDNTPISLPLLAEIKKAKNDPNKIFEVIIDVNLEYSSGRQKAREVLWDQIDQLPGVTKTR